MADPPATIVDDGPPGAVRALEGLPLIGARYRVLGMLGGGGMGNVYLAHDQELDENVAIKLLKASLSQRREQVELLRREVKFARRVTHPNVLRTFDIGDHEGAKFVSMELVAGGTLADVLPRRMPLVDVARIAHAVCAGLAAAHDAGVVHRDLKPSNVLLGNDGRILLADFGISRLADDAADGILAGTPGYMAPELIANETVDSRADIWALGALLYEMLVGERAFKYRSNEDLIRPLLEAAPDPSVLRPDVPLALARIVTRCMAREPAARFSHPREVSAAIDAALPLPASASSGSSPRVVATTTTRRVRVLAVLPLVNRGSPDEAHIADGLTAVLIDAIDSRDLRVPSRGAVEVVSPLGRDPLEVGRDLGAEAIVTGSVTPSGGGDIVIELRVIGTGDGLVLFAEKIASRLSDVVRAAEVASRSIARALLVERKEMASEMNDGEVVELYLQGLHEYRRRWEGSTERSLGYLRRALDRAPDDPLLLSALALTLARRISFGGDESVVAEARTVARRALALGRHRAEAHIAVAAVDLQISENIGAARSLRSALAIAPHYADAQYLLGMLKTEVLSPADGLAHLYTALTLDPSLMHARWWVGRGHALLGEWARSDAMFGEPPLDPQRCNDYWVTRARALNYNPSPERVARFAEQLAHTPEFDTKDAVMTAVAFLRGEQPSRAPFATFMKNELPSSRRICFVQTVLAEVACAAGDYDLAVACVANADAALSVDVVWMDSCPVNAPLRTREDFRAIRERVAARAAKVVAALEGL